MDRETRMPRQSTDPRQDSGSVAPTCAEKAGKRRRPLFRTLEPRMVFDGAADATVKQAAAQAQPAAIAPPTLDRIAAGVAAEAAATLPIHVEPAHPDAVLIAALASQAGIPPVTGERAAASAPSDKSKEVAETTVVADALRYDPGPATGQDIVFVEDDVADWRQLVGDLPSGTRVVVLDSTRDGVEQMAAALAGEHDVAAIHIISHGTAGELQLGTARLNAATMQEAYLDELAIIGRALSADGDILIYGCDFAAGELGLEAAMVLGGITGADIAASTDNTGAASLGGDWDLEERTGAIEARTLAQDGPASAWDHLLAPPVNTLPTSYAAVRDDMLLISGVSVAYSGPSNTVLTVTMAISSGAGSATLTATDAHNVTTSGSGSTSVTLTGTRADLNAYFADAKSQPMFGTISAGTCTLTMTTSAAGESDVDTATITVSDPKVVALSDSAFVTQGRTVTGNVTSNDAHGAGGGTSWTITRFTINGGSYAAGSTVNLTGVGSFTLNPDGSYSFTAAADYFGAVPTVRYTVQDAGGADTANLHIGIARDLDRDGIADAQDVDDDADGILDTTEAASLGPVTSYVDFNGISQAGGVFRTAIDGSQVVGVTVANFQTTDPSDGVLRQAVSGNTATTIPGAIDIGEAPPGRSGTYVQFDMLFDTASVAAVSTDRGIGSPPTTRTGSTDSLRYVAIGATSGFAWVIERMGPGASYTISTTFVANDTITIVGTSPAHSAPQADYRVTTNQAVTGVTVRHTNNVAGATNTVQLAQMSLSLQRVAENDADNDGKPNYQDVDSDNDGITDNVEAQTTAGYVAPSGAVSARGLDTAYAVGGLTPVNTDGADARDYLDPDSDNDGAPDIAERGDGRPTSLTSTTDTDGDGLLDIFEGSNASDGIVAADHNRTQSTLNLAGDPRLNASGSNAIPLTQDLNFRDVNHAPAGTDRTVTISEDTVYGFSATVFGFTDPQDSPPNTFQSVIITTLPPASDGTLTFNGVAVVAGQSIQVSQLNQLLFRPTKDLSGSGLGRFTFQVVDNGGGPNVDPTPNTFQFVINAVNDPPVLNAPTGAQVTQEDTTLVFSTARGNAISITDVDDTGAQYQLRFAIPANAGSLDLATTSGLVSVSGNGTNSLIVTGTIATLNAALDGLRYTPAPDFNGSLQGSDISLTVTEIASLGFVNAGFETPNVPNGTYRYIDQASVPGWDTSASDELIEIWGNNFNNVRAFEGRQFAELNATQASILSQTFTPNRAGESVQLTFAHRGRNGSDTMRVTATDLGADNILGSADDRVLYSQIVTDGQTWRQFAVDLGIGTGNPIRVAFESVSTAASNNSVGNFLDGINVFDASSSSSISLAIDVTPVPDIVPDQITTLEDTAKSFNLITGVGEVSGADDFEDPGRTVAAINGVALTPGAAMAITGGTIRVQSNGDVAFAPNANFVGSTSFTYTVSTANNTETATATITVTPVNDAPAGTDKTVTISEDTTYAFAAADFGFGDPDDTPPNALQAIVITTLPNTLQGALRYNGATVTVGQVIPVGNLGQLVFAPRKDVNGNGIGSFTFQVRDDGGTANGGQNTDQSPNVFAFDITPVNDPPTISNGITNFVNNGSFESGFTGWTLEPGSIGAVEIGAFYGSTDGGRAIDLNGSPGQLVIGSSLSNLANGERYTLQIDSRNPGTPDNGAEVYFGGVLIGSLPNGTTWTTTSFALVEGSGDGSNKLVIKSTGIANNVGLAVDNVRVFGASYATTYVENASPVSIASTATKIVDVDDTNIESATIVLTNAQAGDVLSYTTLPAGMAASIDTSTPGQITIRLTGSATLALYQDAIRAIGFSNTSDSPPVTPRIINVTVNDGEANSNTAVTTVTVVPTNDAPAGADKTIPIVEDTPYTFSAVDFGFSDPNDTPPNTFLSVFIATLPANGTLRLSGVPVTAGQEIPVAQIGDLTWTPAPNANGTGLGAFTFQVRDTGGTANGGIDTDQSPNRISFDVAPVNDAPVDGDEANAVNEDATLVVPASAGLLANGVDVDGDTLSITRFSFSTSPGVVRPIGVPVTIPGGVGTITIDANGSYSFTPAANYNGAVPLITYTVSDGQGGLDTSTLTLTINPVNDTPTLSGPAGYSGTEDAPVVLGGLVMGDIDAGNFGVRLTISVPPGVGTLSWASTAFIADSGSGTGTVVLQGTRAAIQNAVNSGALRFDPGANFNGSTSVLYVFNDRGNTGIDPGLTGDASSEEASATAAITIAPVNDPPVAVNDTATTPEDTPLSIPFSTLLGNDSDVDGDTLTLVSVQGAVRGTVAIVGGNVVFTPNPDYNGPASFTYTIRDGNGGTATATVNITVTPVNDTPTTTRPIPDRVRADGQTLVYNLADFFSDPDGDPLNYGITGLPTGLVFDQTTGLISGTIDHSASQGGAAGVYAVTVTAWDRPGGTGLSQVQTFRIIVTNPAPIALNDSATTSEDTPVVIAVLANDTDPDGDALTVTSAVAGRGSVAINPDGTLTYTPAADFNGQDTIVYTITDGEGGRSSATVTITVTAANDPPTATAIPPQMDSDGETVTFDVSHYFKDVDKGDDLDFSYTGTIPPGLTFDPETGVFSGTLDSNASNGQPYFLTITADDGRGGTVSTTLAWYILNVPPKAFADRLTVSEDAGPTAGTNVLDNDVDPDGDGKVVADVNGDPANLGQPVTGSQGGTFVVNADGTYTFDPGSDFADLQVGQTRTTVINYLLDDTDGGTDRSTITVTVFGANDAPVSAAIPDVTRADGQSLSASPIDVSAFFSDVDDTTLTFSATDLPPGLTMNPAGVITGTIDADASVGGPYSVLVTARDPAGLTTTRSFTFNVTNPPPTAVDESVSTDEDVPVTVDVLGNDTDPDGDVLSVDPAFPPIAGHGTVVINPDGTLTYTPDANYDGTDTIVYRVTDGQGGLSTGIVTVTVLPRNDAPDTTPIPDEFRFDGEAISIDVSDHFSDADGDTLTYSIVGQPSGLSIDPVTGIITGTIPAGASGPAGDADYVITVQADDGRGGISSVTFTLNVKNIAPDARDDSAATPEDTPVDIRVLANDADPDGDVLQVVQVNGFSLTLGGASVATANGSVALVDDGAGPILRFTPNPNFNGVDTFTYRIEDGNGGSDEAVVTITVVPVNDAPIGSAIPDRAGLDSDVVSFGAASFFSDIDTGDSLTFVAEELPPGLSIDPATGMVTGTIDRSASQYGPNGDGIYTVTIRATDTGGLTTALTFTWAVANPAPVAVDDAATVAEDQTGAGGDVTPGTAGQDFDPDGDPLTVSAVNGTAGNVGADVAGSAGGVFRIAADGSYGFEPGSAFEDLGTGETRVTTVTYTISDGEGGSSTATLRITVTGVNDAPTVVGSIPPQVATDGQTISLATSSSFQDVDGDALTYSAAGLPVGLAIDPTTGLVSGTIDRNGSQGGVGGVYSVSVTARDPDGATVTTTFTLTVSNPPPIAGDDAFTTAEDTVITRTVAGNDRDGGPDSDPLTYGLVSGPTRGTLVFNPDGSFTYTPASNFHGQDSFIYEVSDGNGGTARATVTLTVMPANDPPVPSAQPVTTPEDRPVTGIVTATDSDGDPVTFTLGTSPANGTVTVNPDGSYSYVPNPNYNGPDSFTVLADDGHGGVVPVTVLVTVTPVNDPPVPSAQPVTTPEDRPVTGVVTATDVDGDPVTFTLGTGPANGTVTVNPDGSYSYVPNPNYNGPDSFTVLADDGHGGIVPVTVLVTVTPVNDPPVPSAQPVTTPEDRPVTGIVTATDVDGDPVTFTLGTGPANGTVTVNPDGSYSYVPNPNYNGPDSFTVLADDGHGGIVPVTVLVTVTPVNDLPVDADEVVSVLEDSLLAGNLLANGSDPDGGALFVTGFSVGGSSYGPGATAILPGIGNLTIAADGSYAFSPAPNYNGPVPVATYTISDQQGGLDTSSLAITVLPVNDDPIGIAPPATTPIDTAVSGAVLATDPDGDVLSYATHTTPEHGVVTLNPDGTFTYRPDAGYVGQDSFVVAVSDGHGGTTLVPVSVTVLPPIVVEPRPEPYAPPSLPPLVSLPERPGFVTPSISVSGVVIDTADSFGGLRSVAGSISIDRPIETAVNGLRNLQGSTFKEAGQHGIVASAVHQLAHPRLDQVPGSIGGEDRAFDLRPFLGAASMMELSSAGDALALETIRQPNAIYLRLARPSGDIDKVLGYRIRAADGSAAADWLAPIGPGIFAGNPPAGLATIDLVVSVLRKDGLVVSYPIRLDTFTGQIIELEPSASDQRSENGSGRGSTFSEQMRGASRIASDMSSLERALGLTTHDGGRSDPASSPWQASP